MGETIYSGGAAADVSHTPKEYLPALESICSLIIQKMNGTICYVNDLLSSAGVAVLTNPYMIFKSAMDYSVDLLMKIRSFGDGHLRESLPYVFNTVDYSVLQARRMVGFAEAGVCASLPYVTNYVKYSVVQGKRILGCTEKVVCASLPYVMSTVNYSVEKMVQHPYVTGSILLLFLFRYCCSGGGGGGRTMKAPGRNYRMPRADFERSPASYFRDLRGGR